MATNPEYTKSKTNLDGLQNVVSGLGTSKSKRSANEWVYDLFNNWQQLDASYQSSWISRKIVDVPARDMVREWRRIKSDGAEEIAAVEQELCLSQHVEEAIAWSRLYGGSGIVMITNQDLIKPLRVELIKKGDLKRLMVFDRWDLTPHSMNTFDVLAENYLQPEFYTVRGGSQKIHWSHVARFNGERVPRRWMEQTQGFGDSVLRKCIADISDMVASKDGIAELMQEANLDVITRDGLTDELASDQDDAIIQRYELFSKMKSIINMALLDGNETLTRQTLNLSGVAPIIEQLKEWICGCAGIPMTKMFGTAPGGMNSTGQGDQENYYDEIRGLQLSSLSQPLSKIDAVMVRSALGKLPASYDYVWNPLKQVNEVEQEQAGLLRAQRDRIYLEDNIVEKSQVQRNLQSNESYQYDDDNINELEGLESSSMFETLPDAE